MIIQPEMGTEQNMSPILKAEPNLLSEPEIQNIAKQEQEMFKTLQPEITIETEVNQWIQELMKAEVLEVMKARNTRLKEAEGDKKQITKKHPNGGFFYALNLRFERAIKKTAFVAPNCL